MGSLLPLERMLREGAISSQVRLVPVLDGFRLPSFYQWWFAPFFERKVGSSSSCASNLTLLCRPYWVVVSCSCISWMASTCSACARNGMGPVPVQGMPTVM